MELNKEESKFILDLILNAPVQTTVKGVMGDAKLDPLTINLITNLQAELNEETAEISEK